MGMPNINRSNNFGLDDEVKYKHYKECEEIYANDIPYIAKQIRKLKLKSAYGMDAKYFSGHNNGIERIAEAIEKGTIKFRK